MTKEDVTMAWITDPETAGVEAVTKALERTMARLLVAVVGMLRGILTGPRHGRAYPRGKGRVHIASAPGEPPAVDTGFLRNSLRPGRVTMERRPAGPFLVGEIRVGAEYGYYLEKGTKRMAPRPWVNRMFEKAPQIETYISRVFRGYLKG